MLANKYARRQQAQDFSGKLNLGTDHQQSGGRWNFFSTQYFFFMSTASAGFFSWANPFWRGRGELERKMFCYHNVDLDIHHNLNQLQVQTNINVSDFQLKNQLLRSNLLHSTNIHYFTLQFLYIIKQTSNILEYTSRSKCSLILYVIVWLCLTRTGNYQIHEFDWLKTILTTVQIFPSYPRLVMFCSENVAN